MDEADSDDDDGSDAGDADSAVNALAKDVWGLRLTDMYGDGGDDTSSASSGDEDDLDDDDGYGGGAAAADIMLDEDAKISGKNLMFVPRRPRMPGKQWFIYSLSVPA